jgi:hypothetical protein
MTELYFSINYLKSLALAPVVDGGDLNRVEFANYFAGKMNGPCLRRLAT